MQIVKVTNSQEWTWIPIWKRSETSNVSGATFNVYRDIECTDQVTEAGKLRPTTGMERVLPRFSSDSGNLLCQGNRLWQLGFIL